MLSVKTCNFFLYLFSDKKEHDIRFNNVLNRKETFFDYKNNNFSTSQKWYSSKPTLLVKKFNSFHYYFFSLKIRLEVRVNNVLDRKKNFFWTIKTKFFIVSKLAFVKKSATF